MFALAREEAPVDRSGDVTSYLFDLDVCIVKFALLFADVVTVKRVLLTEVHFISFCLYVDFSIHCTANSLSKVH
jgi:hypothetical protein